MSVLYTPEGELHLILNYKSVMSVHTGRVPVGAQYPIVDCCYQVYMVTLLPLQEPPAILRSAVAQQLQPELDRYKDWSSTLASVAALVVKNCNFAVSVADPAAPDVPLLAVSPEFERMTGYSAKEAIGANCHFLSQGCECDWETRCKLHRATQMGESIQATLLNRRKDGTEFLNHLNMRGVCFAKDLETGEDLWYLVGIQTDISEVAEGISQHAQQVAQWHEEVASRLHDALQELSGGRRRLEPRCSTMDELRFQGADGKIQAGPKPLPQPQVALVAPRSVTHAEMQQFQTKFWCGLRTALLCIGATSVAFQCQRLRASHP